MATSQRYEMQVIRYRTMCVWPEMKIDTSDENDRFQAFLKEQFGTEDPARIFKVMTRPTDGGAPRRDLCFLVTDDDAAKIAAAPRRLEKLGIRWYADMAAEVRATYPPKFVERFPLP